MIIELVRNQSFILTTRANKAKHALPSEKRRYLEIGLGLSFSTFIPRQRGRVVKTQQKKDS